MLVDFTDAYQEVAKKILWRQAHRVGLHFCSIA